MVGQVQELRQEKRETPIATWDAKKQVMRARFVPTHYRRDLFKKLQVLKQGTKTVKEYYKEMEIAMIHSTNVKESDEQTMVPQSPHQENCGLLTLQQLA